MHPPSQPEVIPGAWRTDQYLPLLQNKNIGLVINQTSQIRQTLLLDSLVRLKIKVKKIFAPEHGFRGNADAGAIIQDSIDVRTGIPIISMYGKKKRLSTEDLAGLDLLVFDIQDVGVRFYTYINTLQYLMETLSEADLPLIVLDRPNPNGHYVDGPVLDTMFKSFVGLDPIPVVYGMTIGEFARMVNGEGWIPKPCNLTVIPCANYDHTTMYELPVRPSPNLPNLRSILLYPGLCFFEGTDISIGRGTDKQFQVIGSPAYPNHIFAFTPRAMPGATDPPLKDKECYGVDLSQLNVDSLFHTRQMNISWVLRFYYALDKATFFNEGWFDKLAGSDSFRRSIQAGWTEAQIRESWKNELMRFKEKRSKYLLYRDFE